MGPRHETQRCSRCGETKSWAEQPSPYGGAAILCDDCDAEVWRQHNER